MQTKSLLRALCAASLLLVAAAPPDGFGVITAGRETELMDLVKPFQLGHEVSPGFRLDDIGASETTIRYTVRGARGAAVLLLENPKRTPSTDLTPSFSVHRQWLAGDGGSAGAADPESLAVLDPLVAAVRKNDGGKFWPAAGPVHVVVGGAKGDAEGTAASGTEARGGMPRRRILLVGGLILAGIILIAGRRRKTPAG